MDGEIFNGPRSTGLYEVDKVLEEAIEKAEERAAILEHDGGLERKQETRGEIRAIFIEALWFIGNLALIKGP